MHKALALVPFFLTSAVFANVLPTFDCGQSQSRPTVLTISYESDDTLFSQVSLEQLKKVGRQLKEAGHHIIVEGHASDDKRDGRRLSALRASHVVKFLHQELNYPNDRISAAGYAADRAPSRVELKVNCDSE